MRELIKIYEPRARIFEASNYDDAVALLADRRFRFAFLDIDLKDERSGLDVLRYLREQGIETRAIMLSGCIEKEVVLECINAGACGYIPKDISNDGVFRHALDTVFQGGIFLPEPMLGRSLDSSRSFTQRPDIAPESIGVNGRSVEVLVYLCQGLANKAIANKMGVAEGTIRKDYMPKLFRIFKVTRRTELLFEVSRRRIKLPNL
jgi:two-component system nitrate/nitrite response regulator NarL